MILTELALSAVLLNKGLAGDEINTTLLCCGAMNSLMSHDECGEYPAEAEIADRCMDRIT
jgi:hypothetical protein